MKSVKCLVVLTLVIGLGAMTVMAVEPPQAAVKYSVANPLVHQTEPPGPPVFFSDACPATDVGMLASDGSVTIPGDTCSSVNDFENEGYICSYGGLGRDEIYQFTVDASGVWQLDTMTICAGWDTSLMVREETGGGCPGDFHDCDGDGGHGTCGNYESAVLTFLTSGTTYYLVVDSWSPATCGLFEVTAFLVQAACTSNADCDDGLFCTGAEACNGVTGECIAGTAPCLFYQQCDEDADVCVDPDPCVTWLGPPESGYFFPYANYTPGTWIADDIELERTCTDHPAVLEWYEIPIYARPAENPVGTPYYLDVALWTVEEFTCLPIAQVPGSLCSALSDDIDAGGSPADIFHCEPGPVALPDNSGDFNRCEIDFLAGYVGNDLGVGFSIGGGQQIIGGLAADDDFGVSVFCTELYPGSGTWSYTWFGDEENTPGDFEGLTVCTENLGACCEGLDVCSTTLEADCPGDWTPCVFWNPVFCEDPDGDGVYTACGDNCPGVANPGQEDCTIDLFGTPDGTPEGDACEPDWDFGDDDGDGQCNGIDECPQNPLASIMLCPCDPRWWCGFNIPCNQDVDPVWDCWDPCPDNPYKTEVGECGCDCTMENGCMCGFNVECDADGDGVPDCIDQCPGVDDAVFAPECEGAIPTVSQWGLIILALLLLVAGKVYFGRRPAMR